MRELYIQYKPKLWCLCLHQVYWNIHDEEENIHHCTACDTYYFYPTKKDMKPVYQR